MSKNVDLQFWGGTFIGEQTHFKALLTLLKRKFTTKFNRKIRRYDSRYSEEISGTVSTKMMHYILLQMCITVAYEPMYVVVGDF